MTVKELRKLLKKYPDNYDLSFQHYMNTDSGWVCELLPLQENRGINSITFALTPKGTLK